MRDWLTGPCWRLTLAASLIAACTLTFSTIPAPAQTAAISSTKRPQITVSQKVLDGYVGQYRLAVNSLVFTITREGDHLVVAHAGQRQFELFPESEKEFFAKVPPTQFTFVTDQRGMATEILVHQGITDTIAKRFAELTAEGLKKQCSQIDSMIAAAFAKHPTGSVTAGVVLGNQLIWTKSYGEADMAKHVPADKDTIYRIGSITKMFTAVMLEQLVAANKVHLTDPVDTYFPQIDTVQGKFPWAPPVTFFELATHTSGMGREPDNTAQYGKGAVADWKKTLIAALPHTRFIFEPGTHYSYSNIGYATLGAALERVAGEPYLEYVPSHIFAPLGMSHTSFVLTPQMEPHLSAGYDIEKGKIDSETPLRENEEGRGYNVPDGDIYTTVGDMARFASFLMGNGPDSVLKKSTLGDDLTKVAIQSNFQLASGYGIGVTVVRRDTYIAFGHNGEVTGYQAALHMNREENVGVIVFTNSTGGVNPDDLAYKALDILSKY